MRAKKSLGQNFLTSRKVAEDILTSADLSENDTVVEIGPGQGFLTDVLLSKGGKVIAIEKDTRLIPVLEEKYTHEIASGKFEIHEQDILDYNPCDIGVPYKLIANIPYYITGKILRLFLESSCQPTRMVVMIQKEVAERIVARDKKESILSLSIKAYGDPKIIRKVSKSLFKPSPDVDSAVLLIENISKNFFKEKGLDERYFFETIKKAFSQKRKRLGSTILKGNNEPATEPWKAKRPEDLSLSEWATLYKKIKD